MASSSTPSLSITTLTKKYEVFLSFRGEDTRHGFTSHLYDALCQKKIETFIDDDKLERGDEISPALLGAIRGSKIAVVIFSEDYASSKWCLRELAEIINCKKMNKLIVMPVFYHVDPSDVRKQTGSFECSFANYEEKELQEEVQNWREALTQASNLSGWDSSEISNEAELVREIVEAVWKELRSKYIASPSDFKGLVGIHERIEQVKELLRLDIKDERKIIGIWGMGGVGKTTIARAVFKSISYEFDGACIIEKVGKRSEDGGSEQLQLDVLSKVLHEENLKLDTPIHSDIMGMLNQKKVLIVLDDVDDFIKLKSLSECFHQCGLGSRMIITSRDKQVLCNFEVDDHEIYEVEVLDDVEALELFHEYANPTEDCMVLSKEILNFANGNPLAIEVLRLFLKGKDKQVWESALNYLQGIVNTKVFDVLKISYEGLNNAAKDLFPLISENIETLNLSGTAIEEVPSSIQSLTNLTELELEECTRLKHISPSICKLKSLSSLSLGGCSQLETFPEISETMESLKSLNLNGSAIKELPLSIGHLNGLQKLYLLDCKNLEMLPSTICNLSSLEELYLSNCSKLDKLPDELGNLKSLKKLRVSGFAVGRLPSSITSLENLEELNCSRCSLMEIPEDIDCLFSLKKLELSGNMFESLPKSIKQFSKLETLSVSHCNTLRSLPEFPKGLQYLEAMDCEQLCQVPDASEFVRCINSIDHRSSYFLPVQFIFANSLNLKAAVSNVFEESLRIMQHAEKESGKPSNAFSIYLPGNKIPEWFSYQSLESSVNIRVLRNDLVNGKLMGFAICAVLGFEEYYTDFGYMPADVYCDFEIFHDHIKIGNGSRYYLTNRPRDLSDSEHMLLGYCSFSSFYLENPNKLPISDSDCLGISTEFKIPDSGNQLKCCAVHPIYAEEPIEIIGAFSVIRPDSKLVGGEIDKTVCMELRSKHIQSLSDFEGLIGIRKRIEHVKSLLCLDMKDVRKIIVIWGMGGVGKTTIARAVFKYISCQFDGACFIEKVGKRLENGGSDRLQLEVLSEVWHEESLILGTSTIRPFIMELLNQKKVFIVLDDVNNFLQLETLAQGLNRFGLGSRIIITSRDKQVLRNFNIDDHEIYEAEGFNDDEALELFHKHASPTKDRMALSEKIVSYAKGNPLALKLLGLSLKGMSKQVWESALKKLQAIDNSRIFDVLKISYDGLNEEEKKLFLDLACFGDLYNYHGLLKKEFLDCLEYSLSGLIAKSLITRHIKTGDIEMHDLLQGMGREIVCRESLNNPGKRSRLWERNDVIQTLEKDTGTDAVEVISLDMDGLEDEDIHLNSQVFNKMHNLRFLIFHSMYGSDKVLHLPSGLNCLPDELMFLHWLGYPLRALPSTFKPKKLVKLDLSGSNIEQLWEGTKRAPKLKWLNLSYCEHLTRIPNLSDFPLLVEVDLSHCESLVDFPSSDQQHNNLRNLNMSETAIEEVPPSIESLTNLTELKLAECTRLKHISTSICKLKSLSTLDLTDCSKLEIFPEILETMESLKAFKLSAFFKTNMDLKVLPHSIEHLNGLQTLQLSFCENLEMLPSSICNLTSLEDLDLSNCIKLDKLPNDLGNLKSLKRLNVEGSTVGQLPSSITCLVNLEDLYCSECSLMEIPENIGCLSSLKKLKLSRNMFERLPQSIKQLSKLEFLSLSHCNMLQSLPEFPEGLECLEAMDCDQLCQVPDASEFVCCINSKSRFAPCYDHHHVDFIFTNSLNLIKAVSIVFEESLLIMQHTEKGSGKPPNEFSIYLPGNKIPERFYNQGLDHGICNKIQHECSINIKVLRNDLVNRKFMGFAICAVFGCDENNTRVRFTHGVGCVFETYYDDIKICNGNRIYRTHYGSDLPSIFIDSDHMLLGYCSFYSRNPIPAGDSDYVDISIEFKICDKGNQLKCCAVCPIYAIKPIEIIGATIQETGKTSGRRSDRSDDNDEEVEPHPKRICTQAIKTLDLFH